MHYVTLRRTDNEPYAVSTVLCTVFLPKTCHTWLPLVPPHSCLFKTPRKSFCISRFSQFWKVRQKDSGFCTAEERNASRHHQPSTQPETDICLSAAFLPAEIKRQGEVPFQISARSWNFHAAPTHTWVISPGLLRDDSPWVIWTSFTHVTSAVKQLIAVYTTGWYLKLLLVTSV